MVQIYAAYIHYALKGEKKVYAYAEEKQLIVAMSNPHLG